MPVYKDEERGTWYFQTRIEMPNGEKKPVKRRGFKTQREAKKAEAKMIAEPIKTSDMTFEELSTKYIEWYKPRVRIASYDKVKGIVENHLNPYFGKLKVNKITNNHISNFQNKMMTTKIKMKNGKEKIPAPDTLLAIHTRLSSIFDHGIKFYGFVKNPAKEVGSFPVSKQRRINYWSLNEFKQFINTVDDFKYKTIFYVLYYSGMRKSELLGLLWKYVDFQSNKIKLRFAVNKHGELAKLKTDGSYRDVLMPKNVMNMLKKLYDLQNDLYGHVDDEYFVFGKLTQHMGASTLDVNYKKYLELDPNLKKIKIHEWRHSHASYLINKGYDALMIANRLGHADVAETLNRYSHLYPSTEEKAVEQMEDDFD
ncbi:site-specific integrase [Rummeliibacillus suwonensis]|uniref:site-specific integrase n=1 Tax=Rummeliibacillus suwonensis TaxID=1306154 RepID=UPI0028A05797|nr:site-specific integrase [Rummeliibacillus suwonensis]